MQFEYGWIAITKGSVKGFPPSWSNTLCCNRPQLACMVVDLFNLKKKKHQITLLVLILHHCVKNESDSTEWWPYFIAQQSPAVKIMELHGVPTVQQSNLLPVSFIQWIKFASPNYATEPSKTGQTVQARSPKKVYFKTFSSTSFKLQVLSSEALWHELIKRS